jgi:hypothetical protein
MLGKAHHNGGVMTVTKSSITLDELMGQALVEGGFITYHQLAHARETSRESGTQLLDALVASLLVTPETVTTVLSFRLGIPVLDLRQVQPDPGAAQLVPPEYARQHSVLPVKFDEKGGLCIAIWPSNNPISPSELTTVTGRQIRLFLAGGGRLPELIRKVYAPVQANTENLTAGSFV